MEQVREFMINVVDKSVQRLIQNNLKIESFSLTMPIADPNLIWLVDRWMELVLNYGAREIVLSVSTHPHTSKTHYILPQTIFRVKSLSTSSKFCSLQKLYLSKVYISENIIQDIIRNCPNITDFHLWNFLGLKAVRISNLDKLEYLSVGVLECNRELETVHIDAVKLQGFRTYMPNLPAYGISFTSFCNLKQLSLNKCQITDDILHLHLSKFPLLERLQIFNCHMLRRVRIFAQRLRCLRLGGFTMAEVIEIDCPTLSSFVYSASSTPVLISKNVPFAMDIEHRPPRCELISSWFLELREDLRFSYQSKNFALKFVKLAQVSFDLEELGDVQIPPLSEVDDLEITWTAMIESLVCEPLMDGLLWCCHPRTISLPSNVYQYNCIKLLCEKLLGTKTPTCCNSTRIRCWRHDFKGAKIEILGEVEGEWPHGWNHLVDPLPALAKDRGVRFQLEWDY
ncbi:LRR domain containing protein [Trema orientale]|uniref:LRR domain containing protein n=1 Tax=Trema orientale TaxID=63057 RepID=A0A2P5BQE8_TREOI|nr:LRR domain containing protein [Trema orientale]